MNHPTTSELGNPLSISREIPLEPLPDTGYMITTESCKLSDSFSMSLPPVTPPLPPQLSKINGDPFTKNSEDPKKIYKMMPPTSSPNVPPLVPLENVPSIPLSGDMLLNLLDKNYSLPLTEPLLIWMTPSPLSRSERSECLKESLK